MCWLRNIITDNSSIQEGMDNMENGNSSTKKRYAMDWHLSVGLLAFSITMILKHSVGLPDFFQGFGEGLGIVFIFFGLLASAGKSACGLIRSKRKLFGR